MALPDQKTAESSMWNRLRRLPERRSSGSRRKRISWWRPSALNAAIAIAAVAALSIWAILSGRGLARGGFLIFTMLPLAGLLAIGVHIRLQERIDMRSDAEPLQPLNPIRGADVDELL
ncbi:hypothetical protein [Ahrensia sp. R2A130]|uniref:hypothetical protein n=1 Tax=Ahrensia sp. R2A130 TaxID=744979 RepID=UPI00058E26A9|nr:hypothetical protein [Ahrensia sp. R2A130]